MSFWSSPLFNRMKKNMKICLSDCRFYHLKWVLLDSLTHGDVRGRLINEWLASYSISNTMFAKHAFYRFLKFSVYLTYLVLDCFVFRTLTILNFSTYKKDMFVNIRFANISFSYLINACMAHCSFYSSSSSGSSLAQP